MALKSGKPTTMALHAGSHSDVAAGARRSHPNEVQTTIVDQAKLQQFIGRM
jgi:hypothetical protein